MKIHCVALAFKKGEMGADSKEICLDVVKDDVLNMEHPYGVPRIRKVGLFCGCDLCLFGNPNIEEVMNAMSLEEVLDRLEGKFEEKEDSE